ncbi:rab proteins geranylgeranyltransferase component A 1 [Aplochiton taeniatus]
MAADNLPSEFDVVILGTGLTESVIAAACSRVGQKVLHVDRRNYYAGNWASFTFNGLLSWIQEHTAGQPEDPLPDRSSQLEEGEELLSLSSLDSSITNLQVFCYASEEEEEEEAESPASPTTGGGDGCSQPPRPETDSAHTETDSAQPEEKAEGDDVQPQETTATSAESQSEPTRKKIAYAQIVKEGRRFNIDLVSKLMYSRGALVDLLIKSNVSRYAEFKNVSRILTFRNGRVEQVPCSRADVFGSRQLTVVEKRMLMKFLTFCLDYEQHPEEHQDFSERPFWDFLQTKKLTDNLQHFLLHSIAMVTPDTPTSEGLRATQHFLRCLGRYGNTPFLFPLYGLGEIPQCFCRMCAVFGGIYCLRHSVQCLVVDKESNKCKAVIDSNGQRIGCSHFVVEDGYIGAEQRKDTPTRCISRAVLITDGSVLPSDSEQQVSLVTIPPVEPGDPAVRMIELCSSTMTCMPGTFLVHLTCPSVGTAREDLQPVTSRMFSTPDSAGQEPAAADESGPVRPRVLWCLYFNMRDTSTPDSGGAYLLPSNVHVCPSPDSALGSQHAVSLAELVFRQVLPDEEFCPPAPNPEDIIYDGDSAPGDAESQGFSPPAEGDGGQGEQTEETEDAEEKKKNEEEEETQEEERVDSEPQEEQSLATE